MSSIDLGNNPTSGNEATTEQKAQIRAALGLGDFATKSEIETLTNKTLDSVNITGTTFGQLELPNQQGLTNNSAITQNVYNNLKFFGAGPRVMPLTCFGTTATSGGSATATVVHGNAVALSTNANGAVAASYASNMNGNFNVFGLTGDNAPGGYGGYAWGRDLLWEIPINVTASQAYTGILRVGVANFTSTSQIITQHGWQIRAEFNNSTGISNVRLCTRLGAANTSTLPSTITAATNASPIVITVGTGHGLVNGESVEVGEVGGNTAANGIWTVANVTPTTFELVGSTGNAAYTSGGAVHRVSAAITSGVAVGTNVRRFWVRCVGGTATLTAGDDPTATPIVTMSPVNGLNAGIGGTFQTRLNQTGSMQSGWGFAPWLIGPVFVSIR
jgi:hypothetical protein